MKFNPVEAWLDNVSLSHSNSRKTRVEYKRNFLLFCGFIGRTPEQIRAEYDDSTDRRFKRQYAEYIRAFMSAQFRRGLAPGTIGCKVTAVRSFFKYNDLPLGYVPPAQMRVTYHNRDITHEELKLIFDASRPRERAFFAILAQSGLRPATICSLRLKHIKKDLIEKRVPCKIDVPQELAKGKYRGYFTFISDEAVKYLEAYLNTRRNITHEDFLFVKQGTQQEANPKSFSALFSRTLQKLHEKGLIEVEQKERGKPRDVRLYNLRKFFRKHANQAGFEFVQFWMGHTVKEGVDEHYRPTDVEYHRKLYAEKAMPFLRLETATPTETEKTIEELREQVRDRDGEVKALKETMSKMHPLVEFVNSFDAPEELKKILDFLKDDLTDQYADEKLRPQTMEFSPYISDKLSNIAERKGITQAEALERLVTDGWKTFEKADETRKKQAKARGLPITKEDYEEQKKKRAKG